MTRFVNIYVKESQAYIVTMVEGKTSGMVEIPPVYFVENINKAADLWEKFQDALNTANSEPAKASKPTVLERHLGSSVFKEVYAHVRLVSFREIEGYGQYLYPNKSAKKAYLSLQPIELGVGFEEKEFFDKFNSALESCIV